MLDDRMRKAQTARGEELWTIIRDPHPDVISGATLNPHLTEDMAVYLARRHTTPPETLGFLAGDVRFRESYKLKLALCRNPRTPLRISLSLIKHLRIFDLADITRMQHLPVNLRQKVEMVILERIPAMPCGVKIALARRANSNIVMALMERGGRKVIATCLDSPFLTEGHIYRIISRSTTKQLVITMIAEHPKWSVRYDIRFGLIRNFYTPMAHVTRFIASMKTRDLKELYSDPKLPASTRPFIYRELMERDETAEETEEEVFDLGDTEDEDLDDTWREMQ